ncbi:hypothetical protein RI367_003746 [Sorochytrium milnesiophthora]
MQHSPQHSPVGAAIALGASVSTSRRVVKQGWVHKRGGANFLKPWRVKWMVLVDQPRLELLIYDKREHAAQHLPPKAALSPQDLAVHTLADSPTKRRGLLSGSGSDAQAGFTLATRNKTYTLATSSSKERDEWISVLQHFSSIEYRQSLAPFKHEAEFAHDHEEDSLSDAQQLFNDVSLDAENDDCQSQEQEQRQLLAAFGSLSFFNSEILSASELRALSAEPAALSGHHPPSQPGNASDPWNERYQYLTAKPAAGPVLLQKDIKLCELVGSFSAMCQAIVRGIIDEYHTSPARQPRDEYSPEASSAAPGSWIHGNVLLYEAADYEGEGGSSNNSGGQDNAGGRSAVEASVRKTGHEMLGINQLYGAEDAAGRSSDLHTALMCLVDYKGFRIVACAIMPLAADKTLVLDLSCTDSPSPLLDMTSIDRLNDACARLNLKEHRVPTGTGARQTIGIRCCATVEVHYCQTHDHYYSLNLCDLFPVDHGKAAEKNKEPDPMKRLRPEFVKGYRHPLSSDAYTPYQVPDERERDNQEALYASRYLRDNHVPDFVRKLDALDILPIDSSGFSAELHRHGINMRYLGLIAKHTKLPYIKELCVVEMAARCFKHLLNDRVRSAVLNFRKIQAKRIDDEMKTLAVNMFNEALGTSEASRRFWDEHMKPAMQKRFSFSLQFDTFQQVHRAAVFLAMQKHSSVEFSDSLSYDFSQPNAVKQSNFVAFAPKVKHVEGINYAQTRPELFAGEEEMHAYGLARSLALAGPNAKLVRSDVTAARFSSLARYYNSQQRYLEADRFGAAAVNLSHQSQASHALILLTLMESRFMLEHSSSRTPGQLANSEDTLFRRDSLGGNGSPTKAKLDNPNSIKHASSGKTRDGSAAHNGGCVEQYQAALECLAFHWGVDHPLAICVHDKLSMLYCRVGQVDKGYEYHRRALALCYRALGKTHVVTARHLIKNGYLLLELSQLDSALKVFNESLQILKASADDQQVMLLRAETHHCIADTLFQKGDMDEALSHAQAARRIREQQLGQYHQTTADSYGQVARLLLANFDDDQAQGIITPQIKTNLQAAISCYEKVFKYHKSRKVPASTSPMTLLFSGGGGQTLPVSNDSFVSCGTADTSATTASSASTNSNMSVLTSSSSTPMPLVHIYPILSEPEASAAAKNTLLLTLTRNMLVLKFKLLPAHHAAHIRTARLKYQQAARFTEDNVRDVVVRLVHLTPIVCLEEMLQRADDGDIDALDDLAILVQVVESKKMTVLAE